MADFDGNLPAGGKNPIMAGGVPMKLDDYIEIMLIKVKLSRKKMDKQVLNWLLELRTLRGQVRHLDDQNKRLKRAVEAQLNRGRRD
jgi:hypothetical protein